MSDKQTTNKAKHPKDVKKAQDLKQQVEQLTADLQRERADFSNYQRRVGEEQQQIMDLAKEQVTLQILPMLDNIERALSHLPKELADNPWAAGVKKVGDQAAATLKDLGVEKIEAVGQEFDPKLHEAVNFEDGEGDKEIVLEELQAGYKIGDRVIRPSMVKVGRQ